MFIVLLKCDQVHVYSQIQHLAISIHDNTLSIGLSGSTDWKIICVMIGIILSEQ